MNDSGDINLYVKIFDIESDKILILLIVTTERDQHHHSFIKPSWYIDKIINYIHNRLELVIQGETSVEFNFRGPSVKFTSKCNNEILNINFDPDYAHDTFLKIFESSKQGITKIVY